MSTDYTVRCPICFAEHDVNTRREADAMGRRHDRRVKREGANTIKALTTALANLTNYVDTYGYGKAWVGRPHALCDAARDAIKATHP